jgi:hypothetical protein
VAKSGKSLRLCPSKHKLVCCDGFCKVVDAGGVCTMCSVLKEALDVVLNGRKMVMHVLMSLKEEV